MTSSE